MRRREFVRLIGGVMGWPFAVRAQQPAMLTVGFLNSRSADDAKHLVAAFRRGLLELGFTEGQNVKIEYRWARGKYDQLQTMAAELVKAGVTVLVATGGDPSALAAKAATSTVPIVFIVGDPVKVGLVASYNRPGGNATGINALNPALETKRLGLLHELVPGVATIGVLVNPRYTTAEERAQELQKAASSLGLKIEILHASNEREIDAAFEAFTQRKIAALQVTADPFFDTLSAKIIGLAAQHRLPTIYQFRDYAVSGGLMSYGIDLADLYRQAGVYTGRILKGEKPADLPVVEPTKFEFVVNLKTAKTLDLQIPPTLLARADEVIE